MTNFKMAKDHYIWFQDEDVLLNIYKASGRTDKF